MFSELSLTGWLDGLMPMAIFISALIFGLLSIGKGAKTRAKLLMWAGAEVIIIGSYYLGPIVEFLCYGITGEHLNGILYFYISYTQIFLGVIFIALVGAEILTPNYKNAVVGALSGLGVLHLALMYTGILAIAYGIPYIDALAPLSAYPGLEFFAYFEALGPYAPWIPFILYDAPAGGLIDASYNPANPSFALILVFQGFNLIFMAFGFLIKAKQSTGDLRKKFLVISLAFFIFFASIVDAIFGNPVSKTIVRILMVTFGPLLYIGFRP